MQWCGCRDCHISCQVIISILEIWTIRCLQLLLVILRITFGHTWHELMDVHHVWAIIWLWWARTCRTCSTAVSSSLRWNQRWICWRCGCTKGPGQKIILPIITKVKFWKLAMITRTFKWSFSMPFLITRHPSIWITNDSIHCSLPSQLPKTCKKWDMTLSSSMAMNSVMRDIHDAKRYQWKEDELLFTYRPHANMQINWL